MSNLVDVIEEVTAGTAGVKVLIEKLWDAIIAVRKNRILDDSTRLERRNSNDSRRNYTEEERWIFYDWIVSNAKRPGANDAEKSKQAPMKPFFRATRAWDLTGYLLSPKTRRECYEPAVEDMKADWVKARARHTDPRARRLLSLFFIFRTAGIFFECNRMALIGAIGKLIPKAVKKLLR
jgi:hypothetical protein